MLRRIITIPLHLLIAAPLFVYAARPLGLVNAWWLYRLGVRVSRRLGVRRYAQFMTLGRSLTDEFGLGPTGAIDFLIIADHLTQRGASFHALKREALRRICVELPAPVAEGAIAPWLRTKSAKGSPPTRRTRSATFAM